MIVKRAKTSRSLLYRRRLQQQPTSDDEDFSLDPKEEKIVHEFNKTFKICNPTFYTNKTYRHEWPASINATYNKDPAFNVPWVVSSGEKNKKINDSKYSRTFFSYFKGISINY